MCIAAGVIKGGQASKGIVMHHAIWGRPERYGEAWGSIISDEI